MHSPISIMESLPGLHEGRCDISALLARKILDLCPYEGQRKFRPEHAATWAAMMASGEFIESQGIAFARLPDGRLVLLNGYHRLDAVAQSGRTVRFDVVIKDVENDQEIKRLYALFDTQSLQRNMCDIVEGDRAVVNGTFSSKNFALVARACTIIDMRFKNISPRKRTPAQRIKYRKIQSAHEWEKEAGQYFECGRGVSIARLRRFLHASTISVGLVTLRYQPAIGEEFWTRAMRNDGLHIGDPARALAEAWARPAHKWNWYQMVQLGAAAWNAEYNNGNGGGTIKIIRLREDVDFFIEGTPY